MNKMRRFFIFLKSLVEVLIKKFNVIFCFFVIWCFAGVVGLKEEMK